MRLLPSSFFDMLIKVGASRSKRGGQVILFDEEGRIYRWLSREFPLVWRLCSGCHLLVLVSGAEA